MITPRFDIPSNYLAQQGLSQTFPQRFWENVFITPTHWLWEGMRKQSGHGNIWRGVRNPRTGKWQWLIGAHVASWIIHIGPIPEGKQVLHCCPGQHVPWCINPEHLYLGTDEQNKLDFARQCAQGFKVRRADGIFRGEASRSAKLTQKQVDEILRKYSTGEWSQNALAKEYLVTQSCIWLIVHRKNWSLGSRIESNPLPKA